MGQRLSNRLALVLASVCMVGLLVGCSGSTSGGSDSKALKVISPEGGECLEVGSYFTFKWNREGITNPSFGAAYLHIDFLDGPWITRNTVNDGKHKWYIPDYYCRVHSCGTYYVEIYNAATVTFPDEYATSERPVTIAQSCD